MFPYKIYTVDYDGETLDQISKKLQIPIKEITNLNPVPSKEMDKPLPPLKVKLLNFAVILELEIFSFFLKFETFFRFNLFFTFAFNLL